MYLGIEIGGTKLQLGVGPGDGKPLVALRRLGVERSDGAEGIRRQIEHNGRSMIDEYEVTAIGIGFGGPVDARSGRTVKSHQVDGWDDFPLADWCRATFDLPTRIANDADTAALAEARFGAGRGSRVVFYVTVGSGIGGALVIDGEPYGGSAGVASELGHLRPGLQADRPEITVESFASGWAIAATARDRLSDPTSHPLTTRVFEGNDREPESVRQRLIELEEADEEFAADLLDRCRGQVDRLTTRQIAQAAAEGNELAQDIFRHAAKVLGWAVAQMITLLAPEVVVIGGGVPLSGEHLYFTPLREEVDRYVFPPLGDRFEIVPAALGEEVVVHGALTLAPLR